MTPETTTSSAPEAAARTLTITTPDASCTIELTRPRLILAGGVAFSLLAWTLVASAGYLVSHLASGSSQQDLALVEAAYEKRIANLTDALVATETRAQASDSKLETALQRIVHQQEALVATTATQSELSSSVSAMRAKLSRAVSERDLAENRARDLDLRLVALNSDLENAGSREDMEVVLAAVSDALSSAVEARDTQRDDLSRLETEIATMELRMQINRDRQEQLVASLEDAVEVSFRPLEEMFRNSGLDVDTLVSGVRSSYSGIGGSAEIVPASISGMADPELDQRFSDLMTDMDRMNMMRIAAAKIPYTMPVHAAHRFTSGFGTRRDPKTGGRRAHKGIDLAAPRGTKIEATADGVVVFAGRQSGFGNLIKIRHAYGFETAYAHLNKIRVKVGDRIARGDHIGDMGTTGRSTGVHLHYEVHIGGKPVNPLTYIKAARNVF